MAQPILAFRRKPTTGRIAPAHVYFLFSCGRCWATSAGAFVRNYTILLLVGADLSIEVYRRTLYQNCSVHIGRNSGGIINGITGKLAITNRQRVVCAYTDQLWHFTDRRDLDAITN